MNKFSNATLLFTKLLIRISALNGFGKIESDPEVEHSNPP